MTHRIVRVAQPAVFALITFGVGLVLPQPVCGQSSKAKPVVEAVLKVVAMAAAAEASREATAGLQRHFEKTAAPGESIYSVNFNFDRAAWSDFWSRPDVFLVLEKEGGEKLLIPDIEYDWDYGPKVCSFRCPTLRPGSRCVLRLYDDDAASDAVWKTIMTTAVDWEASAVAKPGPLLAPPLRGLVAMHAEVAAEGKLQLLTPAQASAIVLDAPDAIAVARFTIPNERPGQLWEMQGQFRSDGTDMGEVSFKHWYTNPAPSLVGSLLTPNVVFWTVFASGLIFIASRLRWRRQRDEVSAKPR